jgi:hypothetical protein
MCVITKLHKDANKDNHPAAATALDSALSSPHISSFFNLKRELHRSWPTRCTSPLGALCAESVLQNYILISSVGKAICGRADRLCMAGRLHKWDARSLDKKAATYQISQSISSLHRPCPIPIYLSIQQHTALREWKGKVKARWPTSRCRRRVLHNMHACVRSLSCRLPTGWLRTEGTLPVTSLGCWRLCPPVTSWVKINAPAAHAPPRSITDADACTHIILLAERPLLIEFIWQHEMDRCREQPDKICTCWRTFVAM